MPRNPLIVERNKEIMRLTAAGLSRKEIVAALGVSPTLLAGVIYRNKPGYEEVRRLRNKKARQMKAMIFAQGRLRKRQKEIQQLLNDREVPERERGWLESYAAGISIAKLAEAAGLKNSTIYRAFSKVGLKCIRSGKIK